MYEAYTLSVLCFWSTFIVTLVTAISGGLLIVFRHTGVFLLPFAILFTVTTTMMSHDASMLTRLRADYYVVLNLFDQIGILLFMIGMLVLHCIQWMKKT